MSTPTAAMFSCLGSNLYHMFYNHYDARFWLRIWLFIAIDVTLLVISILEVLLFPLPLGFLATAGFFYGITIVFMVAQTLRSLRIRSQLHFRAEPLLEPDGSLSLGHVKQLLDEYPRDAFQLDPKKIQSPEQRFTIQELALHMRVKRTGIAVLVLLFLSDWLAFVGSLMVFSSQPQNAVSVALGVFSVIDVSVIFSEAMAQYLSKYKPRFFCVTIQLYIYYWVSMLALFIVFLSGFAISLSIGEFVELSSPEDAAGGGIPIEFAPGFWTGFGLSVLVFATFAQLAGTYFCCYMCGCVGYYGREDALGMVGETLQKLNAEEGMATLTAGIATLTGQVNSALKPTPHLTEPNAVQE
jgi:hypothetical protein